jgi:hypothetical protein
MFRTIYLRKIRGHLRERSGFAAIRVEIFGRPPGSRVSNGGTLACSAPFTFARFAAIRGSAADLRPFALRSLASRLARRCRTGNIGMFRYTLNLEIRGHLRERSGFAAICVEIFDRSTGSRVSNGEHWHVPHHLPSQDSWPFAGAQRIYGHLRWDLSGETRRPPFTAPRPSYRP